MSPLAAAINRDSTSGGIGRTVDLEISGAWLIDPAAGREGPADLVVADGRFESAVWLEGDDAAGKGDPAVPLR